MMLKINKNAGQNAKALMDVISWPLEKWMYGLALDTSVI